MISRHVRQPAALQFVVEHETCGQEAEVGSADREPDAVDVVMRCQGCGATAAVRMTVSETQAFLQERGGRYSDDDIRQAQANVRKH